MDIGKVPNEALKRIVLDKIKKIREEVIIRPGIGEDCCAVDFGKYVCVLSTDPITGAMNGIGRLAVHISCNDIASCGVEPLGLMITLLAPPETTEADLEKVMGQICETASGLNVDILGGHTEITAAVNRFVITTTAVGRSQKDKFVTTSGAQPGDDILVTKSVGIEGTAIIAHDKEELLVRIFDKELISKAKSFVDSISVVKEGIIAAEYGANAMHDVTEGGILGAVWEVAEASGVGVKIYADKIPLAEETKKICNYFGVNPLKLISSGCMLITAKNGDKLVRILNDNGTAASIIGKVTEDLNRIVVIDNIEELIEQPVSDELYKVI